MEFGVLTFVTDEGIGPAELARALEERGFGALFVAEHSHIPVERETPFFLGGELPRAFYRTYDPFITLTAAAMATQRLVLGTGVALITQRDPIYLAKQAASLDRISGGRFMLGVGAGWLLEEMRNHGTNTKTRTRMMRERVLAVKELWTADEAEFHGEFVDFDPVFCYPKPIQRPHPPVFIGGSGPTVVDRVLEYGDGWMPNYEPDDRAQRAQITELRQRAGRRVPVILSNVPPEPTVIAELLGAEQDDSGPDRILFHLPTLDTQSVLHQLDNLAELLRTHD